MTFLVDENLPFDLVRLARDRRLDALWVRDVMPGAKDSLILKRLTEQKEVLVTRDIGFANLVFSQMVVGVALEGAVLIREERLEVIQQVWSDFLPNMPDVRGIVVLTARGMRVREP